MSGRIVGVALIASLGLLVAVVAWLTVVGIEGTKPCAAALRVGMGDSGAAEVAAIRSQACASLTAGTVAKIRARVEIEMIREAADR